MPPMIGRLALPFTDADFTGKVDVRVRVAAVTTTETMALPSVFTTHGYYAGGDTSQADSLINALVNALAAAVGAITMSEDPLLPGRYILDATVATDWEILWDDPLTTATAAWFGFADRSALSDGSGIITADYQADRLWIARHPRWNRRQRERSASYTRGYSDSTPPQLRNHGDGWTRWQLGFSMVSGARLYLWDAEDPGLAAHVSGAVAGSIAVAATVDTAGTGYTAGEKLTVVGGTTGAAAIFNIDTVASGPPGPVATVSADDTALDVYTVKPVSPAATTSSAGSNCTLNITWEDGDPNICLQSLWEWLPKRQPMKVIEDDTRLTEFEYADPGEVAFLSDLDAVITGTLSSAPPYYNIMLPMVVRP